MCDFTYTEASNVAQFRETDDDPPYKIEFTIARCERDLGHGGDHRGLGKGSFNTLTYVWTSSFKKSGNALFVALEREGRL